MKETKDEVNLWVGKWWNRWNSNCPRSCKKAKRNGGKSIGCQWRHRTTIKMTEIIQCRCSLDCLDYQFALLVLGLIDAPHFAMSNARHKNRIESRKNRKKKTIYLFRTLSMGSSSDYSRSHPHRHTYVIIWYMSFSHLCANVYVRHWMISDIFDGTNEGKEISSNHRIHAKRFYCGSTNKFRSCRSFIVIAFFIFYFFNWNFDGNHCRRRRRHRRRASLVCRWLCHKFAFVLRLSFVPLQFLVPFA